MKESSTGRISEEPYTFEQEASSLGIPREFWSHPSVHEFVAFVTRAANLQADLAIADVRNSEIRMKSNDVTELERRNFRDADVLTPSLAERYMSAELLMRVALDVLREGFNGRAIHPDYIRSKLNVALGGYGMEVTTAPPRTERPREQRRLPLA